MNTDITHEDIVNLTESIKALTSAIVCTNLEKIDLAIGKPLLELSTSVKILSEKINEI